MSSMPTHTKLCGLFACLLSVSSISRADSLVSLDVNDEPVENGKTLKMEFREIKRTAKESTVRVVFHSGGSVSSSMFVVRGSCAIAKSRGMQFFRNTNEVEIDGSTTEYTIAFSNSRNDSALKVQPSGGSADDDEDGVFSTGECRMLGFMQ